MGRVFSPEQIRDDHIPEPGAHTRAGRFVLETLFEPPGLWLPIDDASRQLNYDVDRKIRSIESGMVYGSTALGTANLRSDLDVLITYYHSHPQALATLRETFEQAEDQFKVPVEHHIVPVTALSNPLTHTIDPLFATHLRDVQRQENPRWSYNWPMHGYHGITINEQQVRALAIRYCGTKRRQFINGLVDYRDSSNYAIMQRALELPAAIGRKVLAATDGPEAVDQSLLQNKSEILGMLLDRYNSSRIEWMGEPDKALADLAELDYEYSDLLISTIGGETSLDEYSKWLESHYLKALDLAIHVASSWIDILQHSLDKPRGELAELQPIQTYVDEEY
ncbi:MAG TPA: nucleotidyltransferase domain-containing protein [Candidatus Saccharimonadales bacterium]|nr:nucleotidyltransferase domain-containing protein [Candidatus Saccharimonadales bacterium]